MSGREIALVAGVVLFLVSFGYGIAEECVKPGGLPSDGEDLDEWRRKHAQAERLDNWDNRFLALAALPFLYWLWPWLVG